MSEPERLSSLLPSVVAYLARHRTRTEKDMTTDAAMNAADYFPVTLLDEILEAAIETGAIAGWSRVSGSETYTIWHLDGPTVRVTVEPPASPVLPSGGQS